MLNKKLKKHKAVMVTIPKDYPFDGKLKAIETYGMYAYHITDKKPTKDYEQVLVLHNGIIYCCDRHDSPYGIGFKRIRYFWKTNIKGFQGFRYVDDYSLTENGEGTYVAIHMWNGLVYTCAYCEGVDVYGTTQECLQHICRKETNERET